MLLRLIAAAVLLLSVTSGCAGSDLTGPTMTFGSSGSSRRMAPLPAALTHHQAFDPTIAGGPGRPRSAVYSTLKTDDDSAAGLPSPGASNTTATRVLLDLTAHPHARCLDGSPAVMYIRPGWGSGAGVWNLFQEGGGSCHSLGDCAHRSTTNQGSSSPWPASIDLVGKYGAGGLYFSPNAERNPLLWNANVAYLVYCDGGGFSGDNRSTTVVRGGKGALHFRGQEIVRAAIATLAATARLGSAKSVVISGCSEGGVATFAHLDWMAALVKGVAPGVAKIAGLADSGYYPGDGSPHSHVPKQQFLYEAQNASGCLSQACLAANPQAPWGCLVAEVNHRFIQTPVFALQSIFDTNQLSTAGCKDASCAIPYMRWLNASVTGFATAPGRATGAFVDMCSRHCNREPAIDGYSSLGAFAEWFGAGITLFASLS